MHASPIISANTGRHFNITTGVDTNYDSVFVERPTFAALGQRCQELSSNERLLQHDRRLEYERRHSAQLRLRTGKFL